MRYSDRLREIAALHDRIEASQPVPAYPSEREMLREAASIIDEMDAALEACIPFVLAIERRDESNAALDAYSKAEAARKRLGQNDCT